MVLVEQLWNDDLPEEPLTDVEPRRDVANAPLVAGKPDVHEVVTTL